MKMTSVVIKDPLNSSCIGLYDFPLMSFAS